MFLFSRPLESFLSSFVVGYLNLRQKKISALCSFKIKEFEVIDYENGPISAPKLAACHPVYFWSLSLELLSAGGCSTPP